MEFNYFIMALKIVKYFYKFISRIPVYLHNSTSVALTL